MSTVKNIVLIGFMGTGKTSTGRLLAKMLGYRFVDTDQRLEELYGCSVSEMFANEGESVFRERETALVKDLAAYKRQVISTGGGIVLNQQNMIMLRKTGMIICLTATADRILERVGRRNTRPLLRQENCREIIIDLLEQRRELYNKADFMIDTSERTPRQVSHDIIRTIKMAGVKLKCVR